MQGFNSTLVKLISAGFPQKSEASKHFGQEKCLQKYILSIQWITKIEKFAHQLLINLILILYWAV